MLQLRPRLVRIPDVSFISWDQMSNGEFPSEPVPHLYPDLAVEVLSRSNTPGEMTLKASEYFEAGTRLVWIIDPETQTAEVYTTPDECRRLKATQSLDGGDVLPGFNLPLKQLFATKIMKLSQSRAVKTSNERWGSSAENRPTGIVDSQTKSTERFRTGSILV